ncbi:peptidylprolyl isomerase [Rubrivivax gelatinosus]|uniref:peptidylprolyl isomerase n=1 Tax=Rubrivivax gelatinosus TaxID=28068 RepID=A0A4R2MAD3_RUBGE|nr:peptidylprolyl isomerase [Rubrivivax gelatinosus]MBK1686471.1 peptidylprolyl isomerase [Rubrivivax gelatinosus]TCP04299.1 peptidyl-prolyl cis-trans isomerase C [Rubrivivax gelatinosus]
MSSKSFAVRTALATAAAALLMPLAAQAQNIAVVNGKPVPKSRVETLLQQAARAGQQVGPELQQQARDQVVLREIFVQEAEKKGLATSADYKAQMELARQSILIRELFDSYRKTHPVADATAQAEYEKIKASAAGTEYHARHILVETEDEAKALIAQIKGGASFEELAKKNSKDPGSGENGGDLDFAKPDAYVPEFSQAMVALKKGEMTQTPVKSQFGWHIIRLDDTREAQFPAFEEVKDQLKQRMEQASLQQYQEELRKKARTDYKFGAE